ncbi:hypothetical protein NEF87_003205 [Candidatus Lokiarchaeum ossiferum]|uniref:Prenyltransferase n=1 Tax=Candidatus Lokiarchaeum ossiferum TaxID=2951803 RepID=A0ABY6HTS2_9ARCH|nr:hypothetical protein NEF87_003205 [Candidatus Lokiarchaeum sp. B-35]
MEYKTFHNTIRPGTWVKSAIMVVFGIILTRYLVGAGRVRANLIFGPLIFFLVAISGTFSSLILRIVGKPEAKFKEAIQYLIVSGVAFIAAITFSIVHAIRYNLGFIPIFTVLLVGVIESMIINYGKTWKYQSLLQPLWNSILPAFGLLYGASLGGVIIPAFVYLLVLATFGLQFSKDVIKKFKLLPTAHEDDAKFIAQLGPHRLQVHVMIYLAVSIVCMVVTEFLNLPNPFLFLFGMLITVLLMAIAILVIWKIDLGEKYKMTVNSLLKTAILFQYLTLFLGSV